MIGATLKRGLWLVAPALVVAGGLQGFAAGDDVRRAYPYVPPRQVSFDSGRYIWVPPVYEKRSRNVWVPPKYETVERKVWREPIYEDRQVLVDIPPVKEWRQVAEYDARGRYLGNRWVEQLIRPSGKRWETQRVLVKPGCWETVCEQVMVCPGRWETVCEDVLVREGYWKFACGNEANRPVPLINDLRDFRNGHPVTLLDDPRRFDAPRGPSRDGDWMRTNAYPEFRTDGRSDFRGDGRMDYRGDGRIDLGPDGRPGSHLDDHDRSRMAPDTHGSRNNPAHDGSR